MTDYIYSLSIAAQTKSFLLSLGFGFLMGVLYDVFRLVRISLTKGKRMQIPFDVLYCITLAFFTFLFIMIVNEGEFRFYLLLGEGVGFSVYVLTLGTVVFNYGEIWIAYLKKWLKRFFSFLAYPFCYIIKKMGKLSGKIRKKGTKTEKNIKNKSKILLKVNKNLLYNLFVKKRNSVKNGKVNEKDV